MEVLDKHVAYLQAKEKELQNVTENLNKEYEKKQIELKNLENYFLQAAAQLELLVDILNSDSLDPTPANPGETIVLED